MRICVVMPAFNAARTLPAVVERLTRSVRTPLHRIWVVDDGSEDQTAAVATRLAAGHSRLRLLQNPRNLGYGGALKQGLAAARAADADLCACVHADGQYAPEVLDELIAALTRRNLDLLQGSRLAGDAALAGGMPRYKYVAGHLLTALENRVLGLAMSDYHSGYLLHGRAALERIDHGRLSDSFDFDVEAIASARALGLAVGEHPIPTRYADEVSHLNPVGYGLRVLGAMVKYSSGRYHARVRQGGPLC